MHMIEAVIKTIGRQQRQEPPRPESASSGVTALECKGFGKQKGHTERYRGGRMDVGFVPKVLLKIGVKSEDLDKALEAINAAARTGKVGDGKIFVYPVAGVVRIRTGETDNDALLNTGRGGEKTRGRERRKGG